MTLGVLATAVAAVLFGLGAYASWRAVGDDASPWSGPHVFIMGAAALFIAHHLVAASDEHRRLRAPYPAYFDIAWKHGVQLGLSVAFTGSHVDEGFPGLHAHTALDAPFYTSQVWVNGSRQRTRPVALSTAYTPPDDDDA